MEGFRFIIHVPVRFRDLDALGHVNNAVYLTYLELARIAYMQDVLGQRGREEGHDVRNIRTILAEITCSYKSPAYFGETMVVGVRVDRIGNKSFTMSYRIEDQATGRLVATAHSVQVAYDYAAGRSIPVPEEFVRRAEAFEGRPLRAR